MGKRIIDKAAPYQGLRTAAELSGLSVQFLREGCKSGRIAHVMCGTEYRVNVPMLLDQLQRQAASSVQESR